MDDSLAQLLPNNGFGPTSVGVNHVEHERV